ncbi:hypothetical protein OH77DRAFT_644828 [Trametes cingulata]|nr:hypothetical protein OH77DRAFT_644828 [Trametes cingulata]
MPSNGPAPLHKHTVRQRTVDNVPKPRAHRRFTRLDPFASGTEPASSQLSSLANVGCGNEHADLIQTLAIQPAERYSEEHPSSALLPDLYDLPQDRARRSPTLICYAS